MALLSASLTPGRPQGDGHISSPTPCMEGAGAHFTHDRVATHQRCSWGPWDTCQHVGTPSFLSQCIVTSSLPRPLEERTVFLPPTIYYVCSHFSIDAEGEKPKMAVAGGETDGEAGGWGATGEPFTPGSLPPLCRSPVANRHILLWQLLGSH